MNTPQRREEARKQAREMVSKMTLEEKISQLDYRSKDIPHLQVKEYNYWSEGLHGVARAGVATMFPQAIGLAAMFDEELLEEVAEAISLEARAKYHAFEGKEDFDIYKGLTYWSPNINIFRDPRWGRGQETYGEDPYLTSRLGVAFIQGLQGTGEYLRIAACAKHFAAHSGPEELRHGFQAEVSPKDLYETYLPAFKAAVQEAEVESVMGAYSGINGIPMCIHDEMINGLLREDWGFEGHFVSDYYALEDIAKNHKYSKDHTETMALALKAGLDLCAGNIAPLTKEALERGLIQEEQVTTAVERLYTTRFLLGMYEEECEYNQISYDVVDSPEHQRLNLEATRRSIVLLKNEGILPLEKTKLNAISVIGPNANSRIALTGNYHGTASRYHTVLEGIQDYVVDSTKVYYAEGCHLYKDNVEGRLAKADDREAEAEIVAERSDVIILSLGLDSTIEGEQGDAGNSYGSGDRLDLGLPGRQEKLLRRMLEVGKPVIVLLHAGGSIVLNGLEDHPNLKAILQCWYPGSLGGRAIAELLFGEYSPSGKLPVTFYKRMEDLPSFTDYSMKDRTYRYLEKEPLYPFGFGLTYSEVVLQNLQITEIRENEGIEVAVSVKNTGERIVEEVVQFYIQDNESKWAPRNPRLALFKRIKVQPGEEKLLELTIDWNRLLVVDEDGKEKLDSSSFTLYAGLSQPDARSVHLKGSEPLTASLMIGN
ncbi:glycoside hydrolase family 3 C-terminal domain-containing protein [Jeotgalibaca caeni]|uniref:glycoside hydrolase family 3 C-terminal domain-containing protein n=1 Tax=Jeotgalibaca caeni TaxID=3028623 RepID=UPI00237D920D|nr:glycoside hydrolase family 3 C-terminal domain-containing protein [Jeotgalibaca caeni]MDE1548822.1 glycoside hydrolase family 3 C-terminal domain-containing protein [Jeotgalibaca caeni]